MNLLQKITTELYEKSNKIDELKKKISKLELENEKFKEQIDNNSGNESKSSNLFYEPVNEYFKFGKYKGKSFKYVAINYRSYVNWVLALNSPTDHFRDFQHFVYKWKLKEFNDSKKF